jgi:glucans biosynthesis protein
MPHSIDRRSVLRALAASTVFGLVAAPGISAFAAQRGLKLGPAAAFTFDRLKEMAKRLASAPYRQPVIPSPEILTQIDYDAWGKIRYDTDYALYADSRFPVTFFHLGMYFQKPVAMYRLEGGDAREIVYDPDYFDMPADSIAHRLREGAGFAGFRVQEPKDGSLDWRKNDWVAFAGASYFRAIGELYQYGLSARGVSIDTVVAGRSEEFPDFTKIYIEAPGTTGDSVTVYALLDGPSVSGAFKFVMTRGKGVVMDIEKALYVRKDVARFGLAPLTSMYWFSETAKPTAVDWRPEVHDSDGLALWNGKGERLWRPLNNPPRIMASAFTDENPKGFGLLQRDRVFDHYLDGVYYDRRPSLWVEPIGNWGKGAVQLIEIPTDDEIRDNIMAAWVPETPVTAGSEFHMAYKLHWLANEPYPSDLAHCVATRLGDGGQPGQPRPKGVRKFLVEFLGGPLTNLPFGAKPEMVLETSLGRFTDYRIVEAVSDSVPGHWRVQFDLALAGEASGPAEMRLYLTVDGKVASETWLFQYHPF